MSKYVKLSPAKMELLDKMSQLTDEQLKEVIRFITLRRAGHEDRCDGFTELIINRDTGLPIEELAAFNDGLERLS